MYPGWFPPILCGMTKEAAGQPDRADAKRDQRDLLNGGADFRPLMQPGNQIGHRYIDHARGREAQQRGDEVIHILQHEICCQAAQQRGSTGEQVKEKRLAASIAGIEQD